MKIKDTVGIDISKLKFDVRINSNQLYETFENTNVGFKRFMKWCKQNLSYSLEETLFVFEHTGLYSYQLSVFLSDLDIPFCLVPGLEIKRSLGIVRGKDDQIDATKIALYGYRLREEITPTKLPTKALMKIKRLLSLRDRLVKQCSGYKASFNESKRIFTKKENSVAFDIEEGMIKVLNKKIDKIEKELKRLIDENSELKNQFKLITSIKGLGPQAAFFLIAYTDGFTKFKTSRQFASYCGIAPFPHTSGTSIRGKTKVSHLANKRIKALLNLCAMSAVQHNPEMTKYYNRRLANNKNKMSTINIIRNKLLARAFAVVKRNVPYVDTLKYAA